MKPPFTTTQEMYDFAANQLMNQNLNTVTVKRNLMERGVSDAMAEAVIQDMLVAIEKRKKQGAAGEQTAIVSNNGQYGSFATMQEMYNYAANQWVVQKLNPATVQRNLMNKGVTYAEAETVIANLMAQAENSKPAEHRPPEPKPVESRPPVSTGSFANVQEMYNYAADQLIAKKMDRQTVKFNLMNQGLIAVDAEEVIKNLQKEIAKNKTGQGDAEKAEGKKMMLVGFIIAAVGGILYGADFTVAGESFVVSYGIMVIGGILFFKGLFKMF